MRITFLGNFGVDYSSETHHKKSLEALGHEVIAMQETQAGSYQIMAEATQSDLFIWVHTHGWETPGYVKMAEVLQTLKAQGIPSVTYHLDLWMGLERQADLNKDDVYKHIEHFFTVDPLMADYFNRFTNVKGHYLPAGVFHEEAKLPPGTFDEGYSLPYDVIFVGSKGYHPEWPYRPKLINWLAETYGHDFRHFGGDGLGVKRGAELNQLYANTKVVVGDSLSKDFKHPGYWSDRIYETTGRGGFIIHPHIPGLETQFVDGKEVVFYDFGDFKQLKEKIDYYLNHSAEREAIRVNGQQRTALDHTYKNRWAEIIKTVMPDKQ